MTYVGNRMCNTCDKIRRGGFTFDFFYLLYIGFIEMIKMYQT